MRYYFYIPIHSPSEIRLYETGMTENGVYILSTVDLLSETHS